MLTVDIHKAQTDLSRLVDEAVKGKSFLISKAGKPLVKVIAVKAANEKPVRRVGFMTGQIVVPDDFDRM
jgi:prevent-host-death family protein